MCAKPVVVVPVVVVCELVLATGSELALTSRQTRTDTICDIFTILRRCDWVVDWSFCKRVY